MARCAILKSTLKPKTPAEAAIEIAEALKASKDGRLPSDYYGTATGNLGKLSFFYSRNPIYAELLCKKSERTNQSERQKRPC